jgi:hypothetical protein
MSLNTNRELGKGQTMDEKGSGAARTTERIPSYA